MLTKFNQRIDIAAIVVGIVPQYRTKGFQPAHSMHTAQILDCGTVLFNQRVHGRILRYANTLSYL
jgi:hypothetical protein